MSGGGRNSMGGYGGQSYMPQFRTPQFRSSGPSASAALGNTGIVPPRQPILTQYQAPRYQAPQTAGTIPGVDMNPVMGNPTSPYMLPQTGGVSRMSFGPQGQQWGGPTVDSASPNGPLLMPRDMVNGGVGGFSGGSPSMPGSGGMYSSGSGKGGTGNPVQTGLPSGAPMGMRPQPAPAPANDPISQTAAGPQGPMGFGPTATTPFAGQAPAGPANQYGTDLLRGLGSQYAGQNLNFFDPRLGGQFIAGQNGDQRWTGAIPDEFRNVMQGDGFTGIRNNAFYVNGRDVVGGLDAAGAGGYGTLTPQNIMDPAVMARMRTYGFGGFVPGA